jgi:putative hydrolase of the HAD superfamily
MSQPTKIKAVVFDYGGVIRRNLVYQRQLVAYAESLRARGYITAVLSNLYRPQTMVASWLKDHHGFAPVVISSKVKIRKPHAGIYHLMLDELGLKPEECVFVDNKAANIMAAHKLGFRVVHARGTAGVIRELENILTPVS